MHLSKITELDRKYQSQLKDAVIQSKERNTQLLWALVIFLSAGLIVLGILIYILRKQKHIIAEQSKFNQNLVSIISHEIKEPLLGVQFLLNRLKIQDPFLLQASESLANQIQSVNHILNNLLSLRKADAENAPKISQDVRSIILQVSQELDPLFKEKDIALAINVERHFHLPISPEKLKIVLFNLVKNAIKYSPLNQSIRIYQQGKALFIQDFGIGIDSELLPLLLHKAVLSQRGTSNERGNGMGLFLVGQLMKDASIHIEFIAQEKGTLVKVSPI